MGERTDDQLVKQAQAGDAAAFGELVQRYYGLVYTITRCALHQREDAEEVAQEVFLRIFLRLGQLRDPRLFAAWLRQAARHLAANHAQREQRRNFIAPTIAINEEALRMADESMRGTLEQRDQERLLDEALSAMPEDQRELILLHYAEGWTLKAISERLNVDPTTVGRRLGRAVEELRKQVGEGALEQAAKVGSRRKAHAATIALLTTVASLPEAARASMAAAAEIPAAPAASASNPPALFSYIASLLPSAPSGVATGAVVMSKAKVTILAVVGAGLIGGGVALVVKDSQPVAASPAQGTQPMVAATPLPSGHEGLRWLVGSWLGQAKFGETRFNLVLQVQEGPGGNPSAIVYTPDVAVGPRRVSSIAVGPDGHFIFDVALIKGGYRARPVGQNTLEGTWSEGSSASPMTMTRVTDPPPMPLPPPRSEMVLDTSVLDQYVGVYARSSKDFLPVKRVGDTLYTKLDDSDPFPIFPESPSLFFSKVADIQFQFERDESGKVVRLTKTEQYRQPATVTHWRRIEGMQP